MYRLFSRARTVSVSLDVDRSEKHTEFFQDLADQRRNDLCDVIFKISGSREPIQMEAKGEDEKGGLDSDDEGSGRTVTKIHALSSHCAGHSEVFKAMLFGDMIESRLTESGKYRVVEIEDASVAAFQIMLRHFYGLSFTLTRENVIPVLKLSKRYLVHPLTKKCFELIRKITHEDDLIVLIHDLNEESLFDVIESIIRTHGLLTQPKLLNFFGSIHFYKIPEKFIEKMMQHVEIGIHPGEVKPEAVFEAGLEWVRSHYRSLQTHQSAFTRLFGHKIKYREMSLDFVLNEVSESKMISMKQIVDACRRINAVVPIQWTALAGRAKVNGSQLESLESDMNGPYPFITETPISSRGETVVSWHVLTCSEQRYAFGILSRQSLKNLQKDPSIDSSEYLWSGKTLLSYYYDLDPGNNVSAVRSMRKGKENLCVGSVGTNTLQDGDLIKIHANVTLNQVRFIHTRKERALVAMTWRQIPSKRYHLVVVSGHPTKLRFCGLPFK